FPGGDAARYKLTPAQFEAHLDAIARHGPSGPVLTFDDGGSSAMAIADLLERYGWHGMFFVTTGRLGRPGFLDPRCLRELRARGDAVGSHSHTHPLQMARCTEARLRDEWTRSVATLAETIGERIDLASVPGGHHSPAVFRTAAEAGIRTMYT